MPESSTWIPVPDRPADLPPESVAVPIFDARCDGGNVNVRRELLLSGFEPIAGQIVSRVVEGRLVGTTDTQLAEVWFFRRHVGWTWAKPTPNESPIES